MECKRFKDEKTFWAKRKADQMTTEPSCKLTETTDARGNVWWTITDSAGAEILSTRDRDEADQKATELGILGIGT